MRDGELQVELQKTEVVVRHIADQGEYDDLARIFGGEKFSAGRFRCAAQLSEEVELESRVGSERQKVEFGLFYVFLASTEVGVAADLRKQAGSGNRNLSAGGVDAFGCELQIVGLLERRANEFLQLRILKHLPPGKIG